MINIALIGLLDIINVDPEMVLKGFTALNFGISSHLKQSRRVHIDQNSLKMQWNIGDGAATDRES